MFIVQEETLVQVVLGNDEEGGQGPDEKAKVKLAVDLAEDFEKPNEKERGFASGITMMAPDTLQPRGLAEDGI